MKVWEDVEMVVVEVVEVDATKMIFNWWNLNFESKISLFF